MPTDEARFDYYQWIREKEWVEMAEECKAAANYQCQLCGDPNNLVAHHRVYRRFNGDEQPGDLTCLCESCHTLFHSYHSTRMGIHYRTFQIAHGVMFPAANDPQYNLMLDGEG